MKPSCVQMYTEQGMFLLNFVNKVFVSKSLNCKNFKYRRKKDLHYHSRAAHRLKISSDKTK